MKNEGIAAAIAAAMIITGCSLALYVITTIDMTWYESGSAALSCMLPLFV